MNLSSLLKHAIGMPQFQRELLREYEGEFSLGITRCSTGPEGLGLSLRLRGPKTADIPHHVNVEDYVVPVLVEEFSSTFPMS